MGRELELPPSPRSISSRPSSYESWVPYALPTVPEDLVIKEWRQVASGTHGSVRRAVIQHDGVEEVVCIKLFTEEWKEEYEREALAYALLIHRRVERCIPRVYWKGSFPMSRWNGDHSSGKHSDQEEIRHGLIMEYFDDFREIDFSRIDLPTADAVGRALIRIHEARVMHGDMAERNILLVRQSGVIRPVWIDFTCAWINVFPETLEREWENYMAELDMNMVHPNSMFN